MATPSGEADAASRTSLSSSRNPTSSATAVKNHSGVQLSAADCSIGDDSGAVASSLALGGTSASASAEQIPPSQTELPPPPFEPLFALLTNTTNSTTVHPRIHYVFTDDDVSIPTDHDGDDHRSLVVDLESTPARDAWAVSCASSLGPEFAVTAASLSKQQAGGTATEPTTPGVSGGGANGGTGNGALMLHIEGASRDPVDLRSSAEAVGSAGSLPSSGSGSLGREDLEALADDFRRRMGVLRKVVGEGEKRRAVMAAQHHDRDADDVAGESHEIHDPGALRSGSASQSQDTTVAS